MAANAPRKKSWLVYVAAALSSVAVYIVMKQPRSPPREQIHMSMHDALEQAATTIRLTLPKIVDAETTLTDVRVDGLTMIYIEQLDAGYQTPDIKALEDFVRPKVCGSTMTKSISNGASYGYEYWTAPPDRKLIGSFEIVSCP